MSRNIIKKHMAHFRRKTLSFSLVVSSRNNLEIPRYVKPSKFLMVQRKNMVYVMLDAGLHRPSLSYFVHLTDLRELNDIQPFWLGLNFTRSVSIRKLIYSRRIVLAPFTNLFVLSFAILFY